MVAEKDKEECKKFADIFMSLPEDSKNMVIIYLSALRDREEADKARFDESGEYEFDEDDLRRIEAWEKIVKCTRRAHIGSLVMLAASLVSLVVQIINLF